MNSMFLLFQILSLPVERCVGVLSSICSIFLRRRGALTYGMNVSLLKPRVDILKSYLLSSVIAPNTVCPLVSSHVNPYRGFYERSVLAPSRIIVDEVPRPSPQRRIKMLRQIWQMDEFYFVGGLP